MKTIKAHLRVTTFEIQLTFQKNKESFKIETVIDMIEKLINDFENFLTSTFQQVHISSQISLNFRKQ